MYSKGDLCPKGHFLDVFYAFFENCAQYKLPLLVTNISEKRHREANFYCLVLEKNRVVLTKKRPEKKIVYQFFLDTLDLNVEGVVQDTFTYTSFLKTLRQILVDIKHKDARILRYR